MGHVHARRIQNLKFKKHRFDSLQKPLGRTILFFDSIIATSIWATIDRPDTKEGRAGNEFLKWIDERKAVMLGMMADAADECITLVRFLDSESHDVSEVQLECESCVSRLHFLFNEVSCDKFLCSCCCYFDFGVDKLLLLFCSHLEREIA